MIFLHLKNILTSFIIIFLSMSGVWIEFIFNIQTDKILMLFNSICGFVFFMHNLDKILAGIVSSINIWYYPLVKNKIDKKTKIFNSRYYPISIQYCINDDCEVSKIIINDGFKPVELDMKNRENNNDLFFLLKIKKELVY